MERGVGASKSKEVVVWSIAFLSDHTIISGDSAGKVQVWDGLTGTLVRTHLVTKWDVLALSISQVSLLPGITTHYITSNARGYRISDVFKIFNRMRAVW